MGGRGDEIVLKWIQMLIFHSSDLLFLPPLYSPTHHSITPLSFFAFKLNTGLVIPLVTNELKQTQDNKAVVNKTRKKYEDKAGHK